jgi:hypothetical protein
MLELMPIDDLPSWELHIALVTHVLPCGPLPTTIGATSATILGWLVVMNGHVAS